MRQFIPLRVRWILLMAALACHTFAGCEEQPDPVRYGYRRVAVSTVCPEPHRAWAVEAVTRLDALGREQWVLAEDGSAPDVTVTCRTFPTSCAADPARCEAVGSYALGDRYVEFDPGRTRDRYSVRSVVMHELIHQRLGDGRRPERASLHVCRLVNELRSGCYDGWYGEAVMNPAGISDGTPSDDWLGVGRLSLDIVQPGDVSFYRWALDD